MISDEGGMKRQSHLLSSFFSDHRKLVKEVWRLKNCRKIDKETDEAKHSPLSEASRRALIGNPIRK